MTRQGWRFFKCDCQRVWASASRDHQSPSEETCQCGWNVHPYYSIPDPKIPVDKFGNLIMTLQNNNTDKT